LLFESFGCCCCCCLRILVVADVIAAKLSGSLARYLEERTSLAQDSGRTLS
jgi:hypothetical protein